MSSLAFAQAGFPGEAVPWKGALGSPNLNSDSNWAILGKSLGLSEPQIPSLQNEVVDDTNIFLPAVC